VSKKELDLAVLVADADTESVVHTLLENRWAALNIRKIKFQIIRDIGRDPGVYKQADSILKPSLRSAQHALVMLDRAGSGQEHKLSAQQMENDLEARLSQSGWPSGCCAAIVIDPELELWVWSRSPHVPAVLGLSEDSLQQVLTRFKLSANGKPLDPKSALEVALRQSRRPRSSAIFKELASQVSLDPKNANERAFNKLRLTLQRWFPQNEPGQI
jgi:hypothetical protein